MTRNEFRNALSARLLTLPMSESTKTLDFYDEMICDRIEDGMTEEAAVAALGDIDKLAREILSQYGSLSTEAANAGVPAASAKIDKNNTSNKNSAGESESNYAKSHAGNDAANNTSSDTDNQTRAQSQSHRDSDRIKSENRLLKILIIFVTFPIWITALAIIVSLVFALFAIIWSLVVSILVVVASLVISGVASIGYGVGLFFSAVAAARVVYARLRAVDIRHIAYINPLTGKCVRGAAWLSRKIVSPFGKFRKK